MWQPSPWLVLSLLFSFRAMAAPSPGGHYLLARISQMRASAPVLVPFWQCETFLIRPDRLAPFVKHRPPDLPGGPGLRNTREVIPMLIFG